MTEMKPSSPRIRRSLRDGLGDVADGRAVDEDVAAVDLAGDLGDTVDEVDDHAVLGHHDALARHAGGDGQVGVGPHVADLAVDRQHVARLDDVVAVEQLAGAGVAADVHEGVALVDHVGAPAGQAVDDAVDGVLVARDERAGQDDGVALLEVHEGVAALGDPAQGAQRLALRAGGDQHLALGRQVGQLLGVDQHARRHVEVAEVLGDGHVADHRATDVGDLAVVGDGRVDDLLDAVHVRGEAGHDDALGRLVEHAVQDRRDVLLGGREAGDLGVGRVGHEEVDALVAEAGELVEVGDPAVQRAAGPS